MEEGCSATSPVPSCHPGRLPGEGQGCRASGTEGQARQARPWNVAAHDKAALQLWLPGAGRQPSRCAGQAACCARRPSARHPSAGPAALLQCILPATPTCTPVAQEHPTWHCLVIHDSHIWVEGSQQHRFDHSCRRVRGQGGRWGGHNPTASAVCCGRHTSAPLPTPLIQLTCMWPTPCKHQLKASTRYCLPSQLTWVPCVAVEGCSGIVHPSAAPPATAAAAAAPPWPCHHPNVSKHRCILPPHVGQHVECLL